MFSRVLIEPLDAMPVLMGKCFKLCRLLLYVTCKRLYGLSLARLFKCLSVIVLTFKELYLDIKIIVFGLKLEHRVT